MQPLFLCWMFDKRWLWGLRNPCAEFVLLVPFAFDLASISVIVAQRIKLQIDMDACYLLLIILLVLLSVTNLSLMIRTYFAAQSKMKGSYDNLQAIRLFRHTFEGKKCVWGWIGFSITLLSIAETIINSLYLSMNESMYPCLSNKIRLYCDLVSWSYIGLVIILFLLFKLGFLLLAWKNPQKYLRYKSIL